MWVADLRQQYAEKLRAITRQYHRQYHRGDSSRVRDRHTFDAAARAAGVPVVYTPEVSTFGACVVPSLKAVFYVNNGAKNTHCVRYGQLTHIFLNHGDSDKVSSFNPVTAIRRRVTGGGAPAAGLPRRRQRAQPATALASSRRSRWRGSRT